jgi:hypothetical protein
VEEKNQVLNKKRLKLFHWVYGGPHGNYVQEVRAFCELLQIGCIIIKDFAFLERFSLIKAVY